MSPLSQVRTKDSMVHWVESAAIIDFDAGAARVDAMAAAPTRTAWRCMMGFWVADAGF